MRNYEWDELVEGLTESFIVSVEEASFADFVRISGDSNPLHTDAPYALSRGFEARVVHGMLTASHYSRLVGVHLPGRLALLKSVEIDFTRPVFVGDQLTVSGTIVSRNELFRDVLVKARITNQSGQTVSRAKITVGVYDDK